MEKVMGLALEKGVVIFSKSSCCMCYAVKILFQGIGVEPLVYELDHDPDGREMERALMRMGCAPPVPAVFIGGKLRGSTNEIMSLHLSGSLNQMIKPYQQHQNLS
ncbi:glutaredoxin-C13-like [Mercurialis annua]|uniref:glutaredoxin-C13-like n=1 Tax=Mercurialis annua TaxID=3986 RepID=UPI00215F5F60|nr:glutaredoxin-C13-like [Mercurialis annua]